MQSFFKMYFTPQEPPPDTSDASDSEAESEIELQTETKKVLAGGDELSHYEAPKPWTIRKPVYDKPLPAPKTTPQLGTEDRPEKSSETVGQAMEGIPELHAPSPQGRRDSRSRNKPFDIDMGERGYHTSKSETIKEEFEKVPLEKDDEVPFEKQLGEVPLETSVTLPRGGSVEDVSKFDLEAQTYGTEETASTKAMDIYESRVADRHFAFEVPLSRAAGRNNDIHHVNSSVRSKSAFEMLECQLSSDHFKHELTMEDIMLLSHGRKSRVSFAAESFNEDDGHEVKLVSPPPFIPSPLEDENVPFRLSVESIKEEEESSETRISDMTPTVYKRKTPEPYEPDDTDLAWLYGSREQDVEFGVLPSGLIKVGSEDTSAPKTETTETSVLTSALEMENAVSPSDLSEVESVQEEEPPTPYFTLGDIDWKKGIKEKKKPRQLESMTTALEPNQKESPYLHTDKTSATKESLELALAEAGKLVRDEGIPPSSNQLQATHEAQEARIAPLTHPSILTTSGALELTTRITFAGASIGVLMKAAHQCREIDRQKRWEAKPKEDFDRVLRELQFYFPVYDGPPDSRPIFNKVMAELKMTVKPYDADDYAEGDNEADQAQAVLGSKRGSLHDEDESAQRKRVHQEVDYPLDEIVILQPVDTIVTKPGMQETMLVSENSGQNGIAQNREDNKTVEATVDKSGHIIILSGEEKLRDKVEPWTGNTTAMSATEKVIPDDGQLTAEKKKKKKGKKKAAMTSKETGHDSAEATSAGVKQSQSEDSVPKHTLDKSSGKDKEQSAAEEGGWKDVSAKRKTKGSETSDKVSEKKDDESAAETSKARSKQETAKITSAPIVYSTKSGVLDSSDRTADRDQSGSKLDSEQYVKGGAVTSSSTDQAKKEAIIVSSLASKAADKETNAKETNGENSTLAEGTTSDAQEKSSMKKKKKSKKKKVNIVGVTDSATERSDENAPSDEKFTVQRDSTSKRKLNPVVSAATAALVASVASGQSGEAAMEQWAATRYQEWMSEATSHALEPQDSKSQQQERNTLTAPAVAPRDPELDELASSTLASIDVSREIKGDRDEHGRSYDWPFWSRLVQNIQQNPYSDSVQALKPSVIEHIVNAKYAGCPPEVRKFVWLYLSDNQVPNNMLPSQSKASSVNPIVKKMVSFDVERTYPKSEEYTERKEHLKDVLQAYAAEDPAVGYCSAVALIGGVLALELDEDQSLTLLKRMMFHYGLRRQYIRGLEGTRQRTYQFERLLERFRPELAHHLSEIGCPTENIVGQWLATIYGYRCPFDLVFQVYDLFLMEGYPALFKVALALFSENEAELMAANDKAEVLDFFAHHVYDLHGTDYKRWIEVAGRFDISQEYLEEMSKSFNSISKQSQTLAAEQELHGTRSENDVLAAQLRYLSAQMDNMMLDRERFIRDNVNLKLQIMDLMEQNYRLSASLYEERTERARDMAVGERELHHLAALYQHRIESLEKKADKCTCKRQQ